jgi:S1-C subfamily serine protease
MKVYTRKHVMTIAVITLLVGAGLVVGLSGLGVTLPGGTGSDRAQTVSFESGGAGSGSGSSQSRASGGSGSGTSGNAAPSSKRDYSPEERENIDVYERLKSGVVNISTETVSYNWFLEPVPQRGNTGSGSIIDERGYVLTNYHVVQDATKVFVTLADGDQLEAEVVGTDRENDLAVIKFDPGDRELTTIPMGTSSNLQVGQKVLAIGNPFGLDRTLTTGIISGLGRPVRTYNDLVIRDMIQTDASINPGNSGGPLLDAEGRMLGINTIIISPSGGSIGIGFAVPVDTAKRVVPDLIEYGRVRRGWIQIVPRELFPELVDYADLSVKDGVLVSQVTDGGNADEAGLRGGEQSQAVRYGNTVIYLGGDIIVEIDGTEVNGMASLYEALEDKKPGDSVTVTYIRDGNERETSVTLSERPEEFRWD